MAWPHMQPLVHGKHARVHLLTTTKATRNTHTHTHTHDNIGYDTYLIQAEMRVAVAGFACGLVLEGAVLPHVGGPPLGPGAHARWGVCVVLHLAHRSRPPDRHTAAVGQIVFAESLI
jgi:hypothetical protein